MIIMIFVRIILTVAMILMLCLMMAQQFEKIVPYRVQHAIVKKRKFNKLIKSFIISFTFFNKATMKCKNSTYVCQNGGLCVNTTNIVGNNSRIGFKCNCPSGYSGDLCELSAIF